MEETDKAYLAGFIDGEGTITANYRSLFNKDGKAVHYRLIIFNTNLTILEKMQVLWGGRISKYGKPRSVKHKQVYNIYWGGPKAIPVLKEILPYLVIKKRLAELVLRLSEYGYVYLLKGNTINGYGRHVPEENIPIREAIVNEITRLNHRGVL